MLVVSCESVRAAVIVILDVWKLSGHLEEVLRMLGLPLSERPNGNSRKRFVASRLRVMVREVGEPEAAKLDIVTPAYEIAQKGSSVSYIIWRINRQGTGGRIGRIPLAKRRDELENERKSSQVTLL